MFKPECIRCGQRVGWVGVGANLALVALKVVVGITSGSRACLADALHSSSNIVTAFAIFISRKMTNRPADEERQYGYGKSEFIAAAIVSIIIIILTISLIAVSLKHIIYEPVPPPHLSALLVAILSIITNEVLFRYFRCVGTELRSQTIIANAWANRADCFSSAAVVIGVIGARLGFHHLDPIAAVFVAAIIIKVSYNCVKESVAGLMDRNVPQETMVTLNKIVKRVEEIQNIRHLRARLLGDKIWVDLGVEVDPKFTVSDCETIADDVRENIFKGIQGVGQILIDFESPESA